MLHVTNGDSTAASLRETSLDGDVLPCSDGQLLEILGEGPRTHWEVFGENGEREEAAFAGDVWVWRRLDALVERGLVVEEGETPPARVDNRRGFRGCRRRR